jgi:hypothetical protein
MARLDRPPANLPAFPENNPAGIGKHCAVNVHVLQKENASCGKGHFLSYKTFLTPRPPPLRPSRSNFPAKSVFPQPQEDTQFPGIKNAW